MKQHLQLIFNLQKRLKLQARIMGIASEMDCDGVKQILRLVGLNEAMTQVEDKGTFKYPETLEVTFDNWSTTHYSIRTKDGGWIREGRNLNTTKPETAVQVYRAQLRELRAFANKIKPKQTNVIQFRGAK